MPVLRTVVVPAALLLLAACTSRPPTVLTGDTALEMQSSIQMIRANLKPERRDEFDRAVATIVFSATDRRITQQGDRLTQQSIRALKGLNAGQVIEQAELLRTVASY